MSTETKVQDDEILESVSESKLATDSNRNAGLNIDKIKSELQGIEKEYDSTKPNPWPSESTMPQYKPVPQPTYNDIRQEAIDALGEYEVSGKKEIQNDYLETMGKIENQEKKILSEAERTKTKEAQEYILDTEQNRANMIAQGLERSSIMQNTEQNIKDNYDSELLELIEKTQLSLSELDLKKSMAQNEMNTALENFNIAYAVKLEKKIDEITKNYDSQMLELEKYNTEIEKLRTKRNEEWRKWVASKNSEINAEKNRAKVDYLIDTIKGLSKAEAVELINNPDIIASLGAYYQIVLDYVNRRK